METQMKNIADFLFEARILKDVVRSGYAFLGSGRESIAEHSFMTTVICFVMARLEPDVDSNKLLSMALMHDMAEARTGDLNYVERNYCQKDEAKAISHLTRKLPFGSDIENMMDDFNTGESKEAKLLHDADQLAFILELKKLMDIGHKGPEKWLPNICKRLCTETGKKMADAILTTGWDEWWLNDYTE
jgi:putative hydrolases of HD superfamily